MNKTYDIIGQICGRWCRLVWLLLGCFASMGVTLAGAAEDETYKIPLKLFGAFEVSDGFAPCHFALWQHNRDPGADKYAYLFYQPLASGGAPETARLEIGKTVLALDELMRGGRPRGGMAAQSFYATADRDVRVHVEVLEAVEQGTYTRIDHASLYVIQSGKLPFRARAKGHFGCAETGGSVSSGVEPAAVAPGSWSGPTGIAVGAPKLLEDGAHVPPALRRLLSQYASGDCDLAGPHAWTGARYVVNSAYILWELPCFSGAYQAASTFGLTQNPPQDWAELLTLPNPPELEGQQNYAVMNARFLPDLGLLRVTEFNRGAGDCGSHQVHRLIDGPGEILEFELLEYRDKPNCDGMASAPEAWPLVYRNY